MMNTKINYVYRDGSNYKQYNECIIPGELTESQRKEILSCCDSRTWFVPSQVGLPEKRFEDWTEDDHPFFEVGTPFFEETTEPATVTISPAALVAAFHAERNRWGCNWYM